jgi:hypothetical protein
VRGRAAAAAPPKAQGTWEGRDTGGVRRGRPKGAVVGGAEKKHRSQTRATTGMEVGFGGEEVGVEVLVEPEEAIEM